MLLEFEKLCMCMYWGDWVEASLAKLKRAETGSRPRLEVSQGVNGHIPVVWHSRNAAGG